MGFRAVGKVVAVEQGSYPDKNTGEIINVFDAWLESGDPRFAADKFSGPLASMPKVGDYIDVPIRLISGTTSRGRGYLIIRQVEDKAHGLKSA